MESQIAVCRIRCERRQDAAHARECISLMEDPGHAERLFPTPTWCVTHFCESTDASRAAKGETP